MMLPWWGAELLALANGLGDSRGRLHFRTAAKSRAGFIPQCRLSRTRREAAPSLKHN